MSIPDHELRTLIERFTESRGWVVVREEMEGMLTDARASLEALDDVSAGERERRVGVVNGLQQAIDAPGRILERIPDERWA